jgi:uncharacterized peroxidase-related enzyme
LPELSDAEKELIVSAAAANWRDGPLGSADKALCSYADKLTRTPADMTEADVEELRTHGFDDVQIHDAIQVIAYFNYINRIADAVHVDLEPDMDPYPETQAP